MRVCYCSMFRCTLLYVNSSIAIILMGKRELVALLSLSSWYLVMDVWLFLAVPWVSLRFVIVVFPDHTHLLFASVIKHVCIFYLWEKLMEISIHLEQLFLFAFKDHSSVFGIEVAGK